jgi:biopolymer transport protein ExbB/TolQ
MLQDSQRYWQRIGPLVGMISTLIALYISFRVLDQGRVTFAVLYGLVAACVSVAVGVALCALGLVAYSRLRGKP